MNKTQVLIKAQVTWKALRAVANMEEEKSLSCAPKLMSDHKSQKTGNATI